MIAGIFGNIHFARHHKLKYAKGHDLHAAQIRPLFGEHVVERGRDLRGVPWQRAVARSAVRS